MMAERQVDSEELRLAMCRTGRWRQCGLLDARVGGYRTGKICGEFERVVEAVRLRGVWRVAGAMVLVKDFNECWIICRDGGNCMVTWGR